MAPSLENGTYSHGGRVTRTLSAATAYQGLPPYWHERKR